VAVAAGSDLGTRLSHLLAADPAMELVALDASCDVVLGDSQRRPAVIEDLHGDGAVVVGASPLGLAVAMRNVVNGPVETLALALPGSPRKRGQVVAFPAPIGRLRTAVVKGLPEPVLVGRTDGSYAAVMVRAGKESRVVLDQADFLRAICLAAGLALLPVEDPTPVWADPVPYLRRAETMGLVGAAPS
jgi:hypothetical protein